MPKPISVENTSARMANNLIHNLTVNQSIAIADRIQSIGYHKLGEDTHITHQHVMRVLKGQSLPSARIEMALACALNIDFHLLHSYISALQDANLLLYRARRPRTLSGRVASVAPIDTKARLDADRAELIRQAFFAGMERKDIALLYEVSKQTISNILRGVHYPPQDDEEDWDAVAAEGEWERGRERKAG